MREKPKTKVRPKALPKAEWEAKNENQKLLSQVIRDKQIVFAEGPAGTGKTSAALYTALDLFSEGKCGEIIVSRPMVAVGQDLGFLPGDVDQKVSPYMEAIYSVLEKHPQGQFFLDSEESPLQVMPVALMKGVTFDGIAIIDESEDLSRASLRNILTRIGKNGKLVLLGDTSQVDLLDEQSGFAEAISMFKGDPAVGYVRFTEKDICRSDFVGRVIKAYWELSQRERKQ